MDRAYALLEIKTIDAERRRFSGIASTPELDRQGDIIDPAGVTFRNPVPLLLHHNQAKPVGTAILSRLPDGRIAFEAEIATVDEPGVLKDRVDEAWHSIKVRLMRGVSIGHQIAADGIAWLKSGARRVTQTEICELSLVTIPANASATILTVKHLAAPKEAPPMNDLPRLSDITRAQVREQQSLDFMKYLSCLAATRGAPILASKQFVQRFPELNAASSMRKMLETQDLELASKAAVAPGTATDAVWAKPLVGIAQLASGFAAIAHSQSVLGRLNAEQVPFNTKVPFQTADAKFAWVAENTPIPATNLAFSNGFTLGPVKVGGIVALSAELVKLTSPGTARTMRSCLINGLNAFVDRSLLDPASAAIPGQQPASLTNGTTPVVGTADFVASVKALIAAFFTARPGATAPILIANGGNAAAIRGQVPGFGLDVIASEAALTNVVILDPAGVYYADGELAIEHTEHASLQMSDAPDNPPTLATVPTSLWPLNLVGFRIIRFVNFAAAPNAVKYLTTP